MNKIMFLIGHEVVSSTIWFVGDCELISRLTINQQQVALALVADDNI